MPPEVMLVPRHEGENHYVIAARLRLMREALRTSGIETSSRLMDRAESYAIDLLADPDDEAKYEKAEGLLDQIEMLFQVPARELTTCVNGHRSTVPSDAIRSLSAATYCCPECGKGVPSDLAVNSPPFKTIKMPASACTCSFKNDDMGTPRISICKSCEARNGK